MRISDWSSDVCSSDLVALWCGQVCTRDGAEGTMGDMAIFRKGDRRRVGRLGLRGRRGSAVCGCGLNRGRGGGPRFDGGVAARKSVGSGKSVSGGVVLGVRRNINKIIE